MKILLTGGAGFIGSNVLEKLVQDNDIEKIFVIDNLSNSTLKNISHLISNDKVHFRQGDICDYNFVCEMTEQVDVICHQAAWGSVPRSLEVPKDYMLNNVVGFTNIVEASKKFGIKKIIYASSSSVYGDNNSKLKKENSIGNQLSPYALSKRFDEMLARNFNEIYNINFYGLRYFNVFGKNQRADSQYAAVIPKFIKAIKNNIPPEIYGDGEQGRDFTHIDNVVDVNLRLIKGDLKGNFTFNVATGRRTTVNDLFFMIRDEMKSELNPIYKSKRKGDILNSLADISKIKEKIGYEPKVLLDEGLKRTIDWYLTDLSIF
jgi:UDP-N-acetylglucosamine/UDP-N-acetylgalactosamine 4-epimerase